MRQDNTVHVATFSLATAKQTSGQNQTANIAQPGTLFRGVILENLGYLQRNTANFFISLVSHIAVAALLVLFSFLSPLLVRMRPWTRVMLVIPLVSSKEPVAIHHNGVLTARHVLPPPQFVAPIFPAQNNASDFSLSSPDLSATEGSAEKTANLLDPFVNNSPALTAPPPEADHLPPLRVGGELKRARPLGRLVLVYPELAKAAHVFGKVVIQAIIDETGRVIDVRAVSGPPLLYTAAVDAVSKERFTPVLLNGAPTKCGLRVQVLFTLNS